MHSQFQKLKKIKQKTSKEESLTVIVKKIIGLIKSLTMLIKKLLRNSESVVFNSNSEMNRLALKPLSKIGFKANSGL